MKQPPLMRMSQRTRRKVAIHSTRFNLHCDLEAAIDRVEMSRTVIAVIHRYNDSEESTQFRHETL